MTKKQRLRVNITLMNIERSKGIVIDELCRITGWPIEDMERVYNSLTIESKYELTKIWGVYHKKITSTSLNLGRY